MYRLMLVAVVVVGAVVCMGAPVAVKAKVKPATALVCTVPTDNNELTEMTVVGGFTANRNWVDSEAAVGKMKQGSRLSLYALEYGALGEVTITGPGNMGSERSEEEPAEIYALSYPIKVRIPTEKMKSYQATLERRDALRELNLLAAWISDGMTPRWVKGVLLPEQQKPESTYGRLVAEWLRSRGISQENIDVSGIQQVVSADINHDGRKEVFISVLGGWGYTEDGHSNRESFSYLLMRRFKPNTKQVETIVLDDAAHRTLIIAGFCDLNRDGTAEIIARGQGLDYTGSVLFYQRAGKWQELEGWYNGL